MSRMSSVASNSNSAHYSRAPTINSARDGVSEITSFHSKSPRARYYHELQGLAVAASIPLGLPKPILPKLNRRAIPQSPSDKAGAEEHLMSMRPKKFIIGRSSKGFASDEILLGLDKAIKNQLSLPIIEALLQFAESSGIEASTSGSAFTKNNKGHTIPTLDYIFGHTLVLQSIHVLRLFVGRVSQRARDNALAGALDSPNISMEIVQTLLEWGANPDVCRNAVLKLISSRQEDLVETLLLAPSMDNPEFLSQALISSTSSASLRNNAMLLFRGADSNFNNGEALKLTIAQQRYDLALAGVLLGKQPISSRILDETVGLIASLSPSLRKPWLKMFLYAGASGPRTSTAITQFIETRDEEIIPILINSQAFTHGSFPAPLLFQAAVETGDSPLALSLLRSTDSRSFSDYASTGVHLKLVDNYKTKPEISLEIITQLLAIGPNEEVTSQMLLQCCKAELISRPGIITLIELLVRVGGGKPSHQDGKCIMLAIEAREPAVLKSLVSALPTKKILNMAIEHAKLHLEDNFLLKLEVWSILLQAGATGPTVDRQLVAAVDETSQALASVKTLLPNASLDYSEGAALMRAIHVQRLDILEICLGTKVPHSSLPSIWKQTRNLFAISSDPQYSLATMQTVFEALYKASKSAAPLDDLLHDATQCRFNDISLALSSLFATWGATPNHALGAPFVACVRRSDTRTLATLLLQNPTKQALKYAFEEALLLRGTARHETMRLIMNAGLDKSSLDAALPQVLGESSYESPTVHLMVQNGARLHSSWAEHLVCTSE